MNINKDPIGNKYVKSSEHMNTKNELHESFHSNSMRQKLHLPIDTYRSEVVKTINENPVTIIVADTGAGKSTRVPQFLLDDTNYEIVVTQPRRVAAKSVAKRVANEMGSSLGGLVGFRTAVDKQDTLQTRCLFATDGLQMVRELTNAKKTMGNGVVLVVDEVHEWNLNIETLVAWAKKARQEGEDIKIVLMSATMDHERLSSYFDAAPVIQVPGRCFPVEGSPMTGIHQVKAHEMLNQIQNLVAADENVLVFLPGKQEIADMQKALEGLKGQAVILPLHGEINPLEQDKVFDAYNVPKVILSTNIAQTSLTIPDITAVVDSGLERRIELVNNVETLTLANISQADCKQRAGRAGRVSEGKYVLCNNTDYATFKEYPVPEILRSLLDQMVLKLAGTGLDATLLPFYHQPESSTLQEAKETLMAIEALDANAKITKLGHKINMFPTDVKAARMILEAIENKCLGTVITIAAILGTQVGTLRRRKHDKDPADFKPWTSLIDPNKKYQSDLLLELELFWKAKEMRPHELAKNGIMPKAYGQASEIRGQLRDALAKLHYPIGRFEDNAKDEIAILKSVAAGMVAHLYKHDGGGTYRNGESRELAKESIIERLDRYPEWIVGEPKNISFINRRGNRQIINLVSQVTVVQPERMEEIAPHLITKKVEKLYWSDAQQCVVTDHVTIFNGQEISRIAQPAPWSDEGFALLVRALMTSSGGSEVFNTYYTNNQNVINEYNTYAVRSGGKIEQKDSVVIRDLYMSLLQTYRPMSLVDLEQAYSDSLVKHGLELHLEDILSEEEVETIIKDNPLALLVDNETLEITYTKSWSEYIASTTVSESFVWETSRDEITLPGERIVVLKCSGYEAKSINELRNLLQKKAIDQAWQEKRNELEYTSWITNPEEVMPYLDRLLQPISIFTKRDGIEILGYLSLYSDSDPDFQIRLRDSKENSENETALGLKRLFQKATRHLSLSQEDQSLFTENLQCETIKDTIDTCFINVEELRLKREQEKLDAEREAVALVQGKEDERIAEENRLHQERIEQEAQELVNAKAMFASYQTFFENNHGHIIPDDKSLRGEVLDDCLWYTESFDQYRDHQSEFLTCLEELKQLQIVFETTRDGNNYASESSLQKLVDLFKNR